MFKRVFLAFLVLLGASLMQVPTAVAQNALTLDRILPEIRRAYPGNMSDAEGPISGPNGPYYRIKWVTSDGRVIWIEADARTGRILSQSGGDRPPTPPRPGRNNFRDGNEGYDVFDLRARGDISLLGRTRPGRLLGN